MHRRGFTLIELLVVISIIALLSSVVLASLNSARDKGRIAAGKQFASTLEHAAGDLAAGAWSFDECSGATSADLSGNGKTGTVVGSPTWSSDSPYSPGCSLLLNGSTQYVSVGNVQGGADDFTWTAWIKTTQVAAHASPWGHPAIMGTIQASGTTFDAMFMVNNGYLAWFSELNGGTSSITTTAFVSDGQWHQVAVARSGSTARFFVDGKEVSTLAVGSNQLNSLGLEIGRAVYSNSMLLAGNIDQVRVFSKGLTASEVGRLYASEAPRHGLAAALE